MFGLELRISGTLPVPDTAGKSSQCSSSSSISETNVSLTNSFKGAWVSLWEKESCPEIFGEMEVIADDLPGLADGIVNYSPK